MPTTTRLRVWIMPAAGSDTIQLANKAIKPFLRRHPSVSVEWRLTPWNRAWSTLTEAIKSDDPPDVVQIGTTWLGTLAYWRRISPVPKGVEERPVVASWIDETATYRGVRMAVPWFSEVSVLLVRTDVIERHGIRTADLQDWEGLLRASQMIGRCAAEGGGIDPHRPLPFGFTGRPEPAALHQISPWLWSGGWRFTDLTAPVRMLSDESARRGLLFFGDLCRAGRLGRPNTDEPAHVLQVGFHQEGRYAFLTGHWGMAVRRRLGERAESYARWPFCVLPLPRGPAGRVTRGGGSLLAVSERSSEPQAAWELVRFLTSEAFVEPWIRLSGDVPAHEGPIWDALTDRRDEGIEDGGTAAWDIRGVVRSAVTYPVHPLWRSVEALVSAGMSRVVWHLVKSDEPSKGLAPILERIDDRVEELLDLAWGEVW